MSSKRRKVRKPPAGVLYTEWTAAQLRGALKERGISFIYLRFKSDLFARFKQVMRDEESKAQQERINACAAAGAGCDQAMSNLQFPETRLKSSATVPLAS